MPINPFLNTEAMRHLFGAAETAANVVGNTGLSYIDYTNTFLENPVRAIRMMKGDPQAGAEFMERVRARQAGTDESSFLFQGTGFRFQPSENAQRTQQAALESLSRFAGPELNTLAIKNPEETQLALDILNNENIQGTAGLLGLNAPLLFKAGRGLGEAFKRDLNRPGTLAQIEEGLLPGAAPGAGVSMANIIKTPPGTKPYTLRVRDGDIDAGIVGTGHRGKIIVPDLGRHLDLQHAATYGRPLDVLNDPRDLRIAADVGIAEVAYQLDQAETGLGWYDKDVADAFEITGQVIPQLLISEPHKVLMTVLGASTSFGQTPVPNWKTASNVMDTYVRTGIIPPRQPDGKLWTRRPVTAQQFQQVQAMIDIMGLDEFAAWMLSQHTVREIREMQTRFGLYKNPTIPGKADSKKFGAFILGDKGGKFVLSLNGFDENTIDMWNERKHNRIVTGNMMDATGKALQDSPRNQQEIAQNNAMTQVIADEFGFSLRDTQAVQWFFEKHFYDKLGIPSKPEKFSEGAEAFRRLRASDDDQTGSNQADPATAAARHLEAFGTRTKTTPQEVKSAQVSEFPNNPKITDPEAVFEYLSDGHNEEVFFDVIPGRILGDLGGADAFRGKVVESIWRDEKEFTLYLREKGDRFLQMKPDPSAPDHARVPQAGPEQNPAAMGFLFHEVANDPKAVKALYQYFKVGTRSHTKELKQGFDNWLEASEAVWKRAKKKSTEALRNQ